MFHYLYFIINNKLNEFVHTESCPDKNCGTSLNMPGLMGEVTEIEGRSIFWDSKELEPESIIKCILLSYSYKSCSFIFCFHKEIDIQEIKRNSNLSFIEGELHTLLDFMPNGID